MTPMIGLGVASVAGQVGAAAATEALRGPERAPPPPPDYRPALAAILGVSVLGIVLLTR